MPTGVGFPNDQYYTNEKTYKGVKTRTFMVLSQEPVARIPPVGVSIHLTHLIGLSCCATCDDCPFCGFDKSNILAALSAPAEINLPPS